ncbi:DUF192 domain-containing protein [Maricaulis sp.]|uniref:DUF192 domain-containing protein n=1 Tax=Maricaulis sp. TaxID=1486257 RepID=UPI002B2727EA|nr:DUF192 domain-containing protein [Maricaulis sp.]
MRTLILSSLLALGVAAAVSAQQPAPLPVSDPTARDAEVVFGGPDRVVIATTTGETVEIMAEIATTPEQKQRGLMWREAVEPGTGMLFEYSPAEPASMWMENTLVDLDLVFIDPTGNVVKIIAFAQAESRRSLASDAIVGGVLELGAGQAIALGIRPGDTVRHAIFGNDGPEPAPSDDEPAALDAPADAQ